MGVASGALVTAGVTSAALLSEAAMSNHLYEILVGGFAVAMFVVFRHSSCPLPRKSSRRPRGGRTEVIFVRAGHTEYAHRARARAGHLQSRCPGRARGDAWSETESRIPASLSRMFPMESFAARIPPLRDPGFLLKLTTAASAPRANFRPAPSPWMVELAIGEGQVPGPYAMPPPKTYCSRMTGTMAVVEGQPVPVLVLGGACRIAAEAGRYPDRPARRFQARPGLDGDRSYVRGRFRDPRRISRPSS